VRLPSGFPCSINANAEAGFISSSAVISQIAKCHGLGFLGNPTGWAVFWAQGGCSGLGFA
jgi:hypothetical protein